MRRIPKNKKMKIILILLTTMTAAFMPQPDFGTVISAIQNKNAGKIAAYMDNTVEVTVGENDGVYNKAEATKVLQDFFDKQQPKLCTQVHSGEAKDQGAYYCIGKMSTVNNTSYRVYIYFKKATSGYLIQEIRFEPN